MRQNKNRQLGITLIEMMIAMLVGLLLMAGAISVFITTVQSNADNLRMIRLEQDLRSTMTLITRELRLAGSWSGALDDTINNTPPVGNTIYSVAPVVNADGDCISFQYGKDVDNILDNDERFGFRLNGNEVQYQQNPGAAGCDGNGWSSLTVQDATTQIDTLAFVLNVGARVTDITVNLSGRTWLSGDDRSNSGTWSGLRTLNKTIRIRNN